MAKPIIRPFQSVLGAVQGTAFQFQPYAINSPSGWALVAGSSLPPGMTLDLVTGRHRGPVTEPGVYNWGLTAHNFDGISDPLVFTMGVIAAPVLLALDILELDVDIPSRITTARLPAALDAYKSVNTKRPAPVFFAKRGDILLVRIRFWRGTVLVDIPATSLVLVVKNLEPESVLVQSSHFARTADLDNGDLFYTVRVPFTKPELRAALEDDETDDATFFVGLGEITWEFTNTIAPLLGDETQRLCRSSTQSFGVVLPRDLYNEEA